MVMTKSSSQISVACTECLNKVSGRGSVPKSQAAEWNNATAEADHHGFADQEGEACVPATGDGSAT